MRYEGSSKAQGAFGVAAPLVEWRIETSILFAALDYLSAGDADVLVLARLLPGPSAWQCRSWRLPQQARFR